MSCPKENTSPSWEEEQSENRNDLTATTNTSDLRPIPHTPPFPIYPAPITPYSRLYTYSLLKKEKTTVSHNLIPKTPCYHINSKQNQRIPKRRLSRGLSVILSLSTKHHSQETPDQKWIVKDFLCRLVCQNKAAGIKQETRRPETRRMPNT